MSDSEITMEDLEQLLREKNLTRAEADTLMRTILDEASVRIRDIVIKDAQAALCHFRCSLRNHGNVGLEAEMLLRALKVTTFPNPRKG